MASRLTASSGNDATAKSGGALQYDQERKRRERRRRRRKKTHPPTTQHSRRLFMAVLRKHAGTKLLTWNARSVALFPYYCDSSKKCGRVKIVWIQ
jgi:hypothetical protein